MTNKRIERTPAAGHPGAAYIRVQVGGAGKWRSAELLEVGWGRVKVDDPDGPIWIQSEQIHPDDRRRIASGEITAG